MSGGLIRVIALAAIICSVCGMLAVWGWADERAKAVIGAECIKAGGSFSIGWGGTPKCERG